MRKSHRLLATLPIAVAAAHPACGHNAATTEDHYPANVWSISADGNVVTFSVDYGYPYDFPALPVIFARDVAAGTTIRVSRDAAGAAGADERRVPGNGVNPRNAVSADGRYVAFAQWMDLPRLEVEVYDLVAGTEHPASLGPGGAAANADASQPAISAHGRYVAFASAATNLVPGDRNDRADVFVRDQATGTTRLVSAGRDGRPGNGASDSPSISADGRYVAFASDATDLVAGDTNEQPDVFVRDLVAGTTRLVSRARGGALGADVSSGPALSASGRYVAYTSSAANLVPGDTNRQPDVFVRDLVAGTTSRVSLATGGHGQSDGYSYAEGISADGRYVSFWSGAADLVPADTNQAPDVFVRDRVAGRTYRVSVGAHGQSARGGAGGAITPDGRYVAFDSASADLVGGDTDGVTDAFRRDLLDRVTTRVSLDTP